MTTLTGKILSTTHDPGTLTAPAFTSVMLEGDDGKPYDLFAMGKLAKRLAKEALPHLTPVTITHDGHQITELKENKNV